MQRTSYGFALAGRHYVSALQGQKRFDNRGARPIRLQCVPLSVFGNERHNLSRQPFAPLRSIQFSDDFMGKWVHVPCMRRSPLLIWSVWEHQNYIMRPPIAMG